MPLNKFCSESHRTATNSLFQKFELFDLALIIFENLNQLCCMKEILVLPSSKLFAGSPKLKDHFVIGEGNNVNTNCKEANEHNKIHDYWTYHVHPPSSCSKLISGVHKLRTTSLKGREDDETLPRKSTLIIYSKHRFKVNTT